MEGRIKEGNFGDLERCLEFCEWVLSHPDREPEGGYGYDGRARENPHWHSARRAVGDLVESCVEEDVNVPVSSFGPLSELLDAVYTQFDARLDRD